MPRIRLIHTSEATNGELELPDWVTQKHDVRVIDATPVNGAEYWSISVAVIEWDDVEEERG